MIFVGFGRTRFYGNPVKITENVLNVLDAYKKYMAQKSGEELQANRLLISCVKVVALTNASKDIQAEARSELLDNLDRVMGGESDMRIVADGDS